MRPDKKNVTHTRVGARNFRPAINPKVGQWLLVALVLLCAGLLEFNATPRVSLMDVVEDEGQGGSFRFAARIALLILSTLFAMRLSRPSYVFRELYWFYVLLLVAVFSCVWAAYPQISIKRSLFQVILTVIILNCTVFFQSKDERDRAFVNASCLVIFFDVVVGVLFPRAAFDVTGAFAGFHASKNVSGAIFSLIALFLFCQIRYQRLQGGLLIYSTMGISFVLLLLSASKTSIALLIALAVIALMGRFTVIVCFRLILVAIASFFVYLFLRVNLTNDSLSSIIASVFAGIDLTGRREIWELIAIPMEKNFAFGIGYGSFWGVGDINDDIFVKFSFINFINSGHNGYFDLILTLGIFGLSIFFVWMLTLAFISFRSISTSTFVLLIFFFIHNFSESSLMRDAHFLWVVTIFFVISDIALARRSSDLMVAARPTRGLGP